MIIDSHTRGRTKIRTERKVHQGKKNGENEKEEFSKPYNINFFSRHFSPKQENPDKDRAVFFFFLSNIPEICSFLPPAFFSRHLFVR